jgi:p-aminobenzoyl-glutamate transporter AbgT
MPDNSPATPGEPVTELDEFWLGTAKKSVLESVASLEDAARQLIAAVTVVEGIYFAAVSWSNLYQVMAISGTQADLRILLFISPIVLWLVCLFFAIRVFTPENYKTNLNSPQMAEQFYRQMVGYKHRNLKRAYWALLFGVTAMLAAVVCYFKMLAELV